MNTALEDRVLAPNWGWFRRIWMLVTIGLIVLLIVLAVLGFGPGGRNCPMSDCGGGATALPVPATSGDTRPPNLSLGGDNPVFLALGQPYFEAGVTAVDDVDGELPVGSSGSVDVAVPGRYVLTYTATDQAGNTSTLMRTVIVEADANGVAAGAAGAVFPPSLPEGRVYFDVGSAEPAGDALGSLSLVVDYLVAHPDAGVQVSGFHDASGNLAANQALARSRAETVKGLLQGQGIDGTRIALEKARQTQGEGSAEEARRVEVRVVR